MNRERQMNFEDMQRWFTAGRGRGHHGRGGPFGGDRGGPFGGDRGGPFGGRRGFSELFGDRPQRAERGGVRYLVLDAVSEAPRHGYEIMQVIEDRSRQAYRPSPGVIYPTLQMLEELGHVKVTEKEEKRVYAITAAGTRDLEAHRDEVASFYEQSEDALDDYPVELGDLMHMVKRLLRAFRRSARRGRLTAEVMAQVRTTLEEAVTKLETLVDADPPRRR